MHVLDTAPEETTQQALNCTFQVRLQQSCAVVDPPMESVIQLLMSLANERKKS